MKLKFLLILLQQKDTSLVSGSCYERSTKRAILWCWRCSYGEDVSLTELRLNQNGLSRNHCKYIYVEKERERERIYIY